MAVEAVLTNRFAYITAATDEELDQLSEFWSYYPAGYYFSPKYQSRMWDGRIRMMRDGKVPAGLFRATKKAAASECDVLFRVKTDRPVLTPARSLQASLDKRFVYQEECCLNMITAMPKGGGVILSATGSGKTAIAGKFFKCLDVQCLFVVDTLDLLYQNRKEVEQWAGEPVGIVGNSKFLPKRITVATIQTLHRHRYDPAFVKWFKKVKIVVVDELHEQMSRRNFKILETINPVACYGLTATLQLKKKPVRMRAYSFAGPVIYKFPLSEGVERGVLSKGRVLQLLFEYEPIPEDSYSQSYEDQVWNNETKLNAAAKIIRYLIKQGRYVIALADRPVHVDALDSLLLDVPHRLAYGDIDPQKRVRSRKKFDDGDLQLILANRVFKKGISVRRVDVIIDMAELKSKNDAQQKFGRGVRLHPDKDELLYIDIGTQGENRYSKAAKSRARALRELGIEVKVVKVDDPISALQALKADIRKREKRDEPQ